MVKIFGNQNRNLYQCEECGLWYKEKEMAEKCQAWCQKYKSCNLEIIKGATQPPTENGKNQLQPHEK